MGGGMVRVVFCVWMKEVLERQNQKSLVCSCPSTIIDRPLAKWAELPITNYTNTLFTQFHPQDLITDSRDIRCLRPLKIVDCTYETDWIGSTFGAREEKGENALYEDELESIYPLFLLLLPGSFFQSSLQAYLVKF